MDRGALRATVYGITKSRTRLSDLTLSLYFSKALLITMGKFILLRRPCLHPL